MCGSRCSRPPAIPSPARSPPKTQPSSARARWHHPTSSKTRSPSGDRDVELGRPLIRDPLVACCRGYIRAIDDAGLRREDMDGSRPIRAAAAGPPATPRAAPPRWRTPCGCARPGSVGDPKHPGSPARSSTRCARWPRSLPARAVLPHRVGVDPRGAPATRAYPARRRPHRRRHAMADPLRRDVGRELDRDERVAAHAPLRHDPRNARLDRVEPRANAARNPTAIYREPLTMDDYFTAR